MAIQDLIGVVARLAPVHDVEGQILHDGAYHLVALLPRVDELALVPRPDIKPFVVADDTFLGVVEIPFAHLADGDLNWLYFHHFSATSGFLFLISSLGYVCM